MKVVCTGKGASMSLPKVFSHVIELSAKAKPHVLYLGTPSYDDQNIFQIQTAGFQGAGCSIMKMNLSEVPTSRKKATNEESVINYPTYEEMEKEVHKADIIMVSGGNTLYGMQRWKKSGMDEILNAASKLGDKSPVFCGGSAGAICWFEHGNSDSMNPSSFLNPDPELSDEEKNNWDYIKISGLGFLPALCVPHYDAMQHNGIIRSIASEKMVKDMSDYPCIGIDEEAAFVVDGDNVRVIDGDNNGVKCYRKVFNSQKQEMEVLSIEESHGNMLLIDLFDLN